MNLHTGFPNHWDHGTMLDHRIWSHEFPQQPDWIELSEIQPDSSGVSHHPFQGQIDHFIHCLHRPTRKLTATWPTLR
jgi:hypothetical protein